MRVKILVSAAISFTLAIFALSVGADNVPIPENSCYLSAYNEIGVKKYEEKIGRKIAVVMFYTNWESDFPRKLCDSYVANNNIPHLSWEPYRVGGSENDPEGINENSNMNIIAGNKDSYIRKYAQDIAEWGQPLFIRFGLEMNGDWYEWSGAYSGKETKTEYGDPEKYDGAERFADAWRHIHDIFSEEGATNVSWVFAPNCTDEPNQPWNKMELYYPGDDYVDWLGIDGYNWGTGEWQSFSDVFDYPLQRLATLGDQPFMIAEFASGEKGGDKADWITSTFQTIKNDYPRIKAVTWFDINKEQSWSVMTPSNVLEAYKAAVNDPYYIGDVTESTKLTTTVLKPHLLPVSIQNTSGQLRISSFVQGAFDMRFFSLSGRLLQIVNSKGSNTHIRTNELGAGYYVLYIDSGGKSFKRIIQVY